MNRRVFMGMATAAVLSVSAFGAVSTVTLTKEQKTSLLFMYQEEKVARDVYTTLGKKYPTATTFSSIKSSEQTHMDTVKALCIKYGVNITGVNDTQVGNFILPELQALYNTLIVQGSVSLLEAQKVGVAIEKKDIEDLLVAQVGMPTDVVNKFENLRQGSYNHLDAFNKAVAAIK